ncbi:MAG: response regulator [Calditrichaeota bacterium]|nr:response regulator [Calditrichota bacterium]
MASTQPDKLILVVEPDPVVAARLEDLFRSQGWSVEVRHDARRAREFLQTTRPHLVVLEPLLPDEHGLALVKELKNHPRWGFVPTLVLSEDLEPEARLRALKAGALDYMTKPYEREELLFRVRNLLQLAADEKATATHEKVSPEQKLLSALLERQVQQLVPDVDRNSRYGYSVAQALQLLDDAQPGEELDLLDELASRGKLEREFYDVVHLCPTCGWHDLNFREVCPACESPNIKVQQLVRHVTCGHVAPRSAFSEAGRRCPKCGRETEPESLAPAGVRFTCNHCHNTFAEPIVVCRCLNCGELHDVDALETRVIWSYRLQAIEQEEEPPRRHVEPSVLRPLIRGDVAVLNEHEILAKLEQALAEAAQRNSQLSLIQIAIEGLGKLRVRMGEEKLRRLLVAAVSRLFRVLRASDFLGYYGSSGFLLVLPDTDLAEAKILAERVLVYMRQVLPGLFISVRLAGFPQDGRSVDELLEMLEVGIETVSLS